MDEIYNIVKIENLKEYLNRRGVSPKILNNPRIYELLNAISDDLNIINLGEETRKYLEEKLEVLPDGSIKYMNGLKRVIIRHKDSNLFTKTEIYNKNKSEVIAEKRLFNSKGVEYVYEIDTADAEKENFIKNIGYIPRERIRYERDLKTLRFIIKTLNNSRFSMKTYLMQKVPFMLQNIRIKKEDLQSANLRGNNIDDISDVVTNNKAEYEIIREVFSKEETTENFLKRYQEFNKEYFKSRRYEEYISAMAGIKLERD